MGFYFREFKAGDRNTFINSLNLKGLNVEKYDNKKMERFSDKFSLEEAVDSTLFPPNESLDGFFAEPIVLKDLENNNIYHLRVAPFSFFSTDYEDKNIQYDSKDLPLERNDAGIWVSTDNEFNLLLFEKGRTYDDGNLSSTSMEGKFISEFESFEDFSKDPPNYNDVYAKDPTISVAKPEFDISELVASQLELGEKLLNESILNLNELKKAKELGELESAMWSVEEVDKLYNAKISTDDKRAFLIWLQNRNQQQLQGEFYDMYGTEFPTPPNVIIELMRKGKLFYVESAPITERLQPKVIFQSGNIWNKWKSLQDDNKVDKEKFLSLWGQEILDIHLKVLKPIWEDTWEKRLRFKGDKTMRITLLPTSDMAQNVVVDTYISPRDRNNQKKNFEIYQKNEKGQFKEDLSLRRSDFEKKNNNFVTKKKIPLVTAFLLWLKDAGIGESASAYGVQWSKTTKSYEDVRDKFIKPINNPYASDKKAGKDKWAREKDDAKRVGTRLFSEFLDKGLLATDTKKLENIWNSTYNYYRDPVLDEVPIGFTYKKYLDNLHLFALRYANLKAIRYYLTRGCVGLAYGVGIGKTFCSIMVMKQGLDLGLTKRPVVIVPNQVYFQFGQEIQRGLGKEFNPLLEDTRLNMFYNGSGIYNSKGNNAVDGINLCTYEATKNFQFIKDKLYAEIDGELEPTSDWLIRASKIMFQGGVNNNSPKLVNETLSAQKGIIFNEVDVDESVKEEDNEIIELEEGGKVKQKNVEPIYINSESVDWDMVVVDEAHNFNSLFQGVKAKALSEQTDSSKVNREDNPYSAIRETAGKQASSRAEKLYWLSQFIQSKSRIKNTILLSATPFTNSPVQVFSLLTLLDYDALIETKVDIMKDFFDLFALIEYAEDFKTDLRIVKRLKLTGWVNIIAMQKLIYRLFDKSSPQEEEDAVIRPKKIVLPLKKMDVDGKIIDLASENTISTTIKMSQKQKELWDKVRTYAQNSKAKYEDICNEETTNTTKLGKYKPSKVSKEEGEEQTDVEDANDLVDGTKEGEKSKREAKALQCLGWGRQICLDPYLFKCSGYKEDPTGKEYVEASPKLLYTAECIRSVKKYHEENGSVVSGQIIYMNYGVEAFPLIREYLVDEIGFNANEIGIISGKGNYVGKKRYNNKLDVQDFFLGRKKDVETGEYVQIQDSKRIKVLLGSEAIKEGINLQDYASVLYNCFLDFNPTDQVQVEGRIWRQGNAFANVRIVIPLIADCIDIFMFQKLQDKTERINQLWTRAGNKNELDTTSFNPEELKYELMTDARAIAMLDRENKNDKIDEEIVTESEQLSNYVTLKSLFEGRDKIINKGSERNVELFQLYHNLSQVRPDFFDKPLINLKGLKKYINSLWALMKTKKDDLASYYYQEYDFVKELQSNLQKNKLTANDGIMFDEIMMKLTRLFKQMGVDSTNVLRIDYPKLESQIANFNSLFNYTRLDLIEAMVTFNKEQKFGIPFYYVKNWKDAYAKGKDIPIIDGDEVSYVGKKGRKKGKAEFVLNVYGRYIINDLTDFFKDVGANSYDDDETKERGDEFLKRALKESKTKITEEQIQENDFFSNEEGRNYDESVEKEVKKLLMWWIKNAPFTYNLYNEDGTLDDNYIADKIDIGEVEDINVEDKKVELVKKEKSTNPAPNKRPDSFRYDNKGNIDYINDIFLFLKQVDRGFIDIGEENYIKFTGNVNLRKTYFLQANSFEETNKLPLVVSDDRSYYTDNKLYIDAVYGGFKQDYFYGRIDISKTTWIEVQDSFPLEYGMYRNGYDELYSNSMPTILADFKVAFKTKLEPYGLLKLSDVEEKLNEVKTTINTLKLEQKNLYTDERFEELVQEVKRKQESLAKEEIRAGNSFRARAEAFANPNPEYLGNEYLDLFETRGDAKGQRFDEAVVVIEEEPTEKETSNISEKQKAQELINKYNNLLKFLDDEKSELTKGYIAKLQMALKYM